MKPRIGIGRQMEDLLQKRIDDAAPRASRNSGGADGEWRDREIGLPYQTADWRAQRAPRIDRTPIDIDDLRRRGFEKLSMEVRANERLDATTGPLDELLQEIDRRGVEAEPAPFGFRPMATPDRAAREAFGDGSRGQGESSAFSADRWDARSRYESAQPRASVDPSPLFDRSTALGFDCASPADRPSCGLDVATRGGAGRSTTDLFARGPIAISRIDQSELMREMLCETQDDAAARLRCGFERQADDVPAKPLDTIAKQLDDLAREVSQREGGATNDEIAAFKQRLTVLARETAIEAERKLLDGDGRAREQAAPMSREAEQLPSDNVPYDDDRHRLFELRARRNDDWSEFGDDGPRVDAPAMRVDHGPTSAFEPDLSFLLESTAPEHKPEPQGGESDGILREEDEPGSFTQDQLVAVASDRWLARPDRERDVPMVPDDRWTASDRDLPSIPPARSTNLSDKRRSRSTIAPMIRAGLAAVLAIAIVVPGAYYARSRMADLSAAGPTTTVVYERAPTAEAAAAGPLTIMPANTVARFQDLVFQLPRLYGIYAINSGRLFELESLPGQAPDPRIAVSAAIPRPSRTTLPDGRVAFLLFRRDMASNIPERVSVRVVARIKRSMTGPADEQRASGSDDAWTIRNIAVDFRVAPVEHNKEMVLLLSEKSDFTFSAGRYALILKGQAYDFTVAGPITDPAQCLERVEAANGSFFHECQAAPAVAEPSSQDTPPLAARSVPKPRRQSELHARAEDQPPKVRKSR